MNLVSMKLSPMEAKEEYGGSMLCKPKPENLPKYPYGLSLYLDDEALAKLGIVNLPDVGTVLTLHALVEVTSNSQRQSQEGKTVCMDLQLTDMALSAGPELTPAQALYSVSKMKP